MASRKGPEQNGEVGEQMSQLQGLVEQMKESFIQAMDELSLIQHGDQLLQRKVESNKEETDRRMEEITESVNQIRTDLSAVLAEVQKSNRATEKLTEQFEKLRKEQSRVRKKLKQTQPKDEEQRQDHRKQSIPLSSKSDNDNINNNSHYAANKPSSLGIDGIQARRRKSMPGAVSSQPVISGEHRDRGSRLREAARTRQMAPMMQPFMDSLPDSNDLNNNGVFMKMQDDQSSSRQYDVTSMDPNNSSPVSSDVDQVEGEHPIKFVPSEKRVIFSHLEQRRDSVNSTEGQKLRLAEDFLLSERKYVGQLNALLDNIMLPLVTESLIHASDINLLFSPCLTKMFDRHCCLLCALETHLNDGRWQEMHTDVFTKFVGVENANLLSQYRSYISTFPESISLLSRHTRKSAKLTNFLKKQLSDIEDEQADLLGYLLAPIQRIPAYVLHLQTVLEYTESSHPDYDNIESCLTHLGNFVAEMNSDIEEAIHAARTNKLFLSDRRQSLASSNALHTLMSSQSSLNNGSGIQSMEDIQVYNQYTHHQSSQHDVNSSLMNGSHGVRSGNQVIHRQPHHHHNKTLPNGYKTSRRASFPGYSLMDHKGAVKGMGGSILKSSQSNHTRLGQRRGSYDQRMLSEMHHHHKHMFGDIPGMMFIPEQTSDDAESKHRPRAKERSRNRRSTSPSHLPKKYGMYGENDTDEENGYEPSSPTSALPRSRSRQSRASHQQQQSPRHGARATPPTSSDSLSTASTPRDSQHYDGSPRTQIVLEEGDIHSQQKYHHRSAAESTKHQNAKSVRSEDSPPHSQPGSRAEGRKRLHSMSHANRIGTPESTKPNILKDVWNESKDVSESKETSSVTPRAKQKPNLNKTPRDDSTLPAKSAKKSHFLTGSLKNIFFGKSRKRGSHVVELSEETNGTMNRRRSEEQSSASLKADTYSDEDGEPCSNV